jgi:hypothetical protein
LIFLRIRSLPFYQFALVISVATIIGMAAKLSAAEPEEGLKIKQPSPAAGEGGDPIVSIGKKMSDLATRLSKSAPEADPHVVQLQQQIVKQLDALLKELEKQSQGQSSKSNSSGGGLGGQQNKRTSIGKKTPGQANPQADGKGKSREGDSRESSQRVGKAAPKINLAELLQVVKQVWGHLPEKERERLRQLSADQVLPGHDLAVEKYFRRLANESKREEIEQ